MNIKQLVPRWDFLSWHRDRFGAVSALAQYPKALLGTVRAPIDGGSVLLRPGTADQTVYDEVFRIREYAIDLPFEPRVIVDAGAHIGLASVFFARRYPDAKIIAIEPDADNFRMLCRNLAPYRNAITIRAGVWNRPAKLAIENPNGDTWSFRVVEREDGITAVTIDELIEQHGPIDLLKMDIEGSEKPVLEHSQAWMPRIGALVIELHDRYVAGCTDALETAIAGLPFARGVSGESVVLIRSA